MAHKIYHMMTKVFKFWHEGMGRLSWKRDPWWTSHWRMQYFCCFSGSISHALCHTHHPSPSNASDTWLQGASPSCPYCHAWRTACRTHSCLIQSEQSVGGEDSKGTGKQITISILFLSILVIVILQNTSGKSAK